MIKDFFKIAVLNLTRRKVRTFLTSLSIVVAITTLVALVSMGNGLMNSIETTFEEIGTDKIMVMPTSVNSNPLSGGFNDYELRKIRQTEGVLNAGAYVVGVTSISYGDEKVYSIVTGISNDESIDIIKSMQNLNVIQGRMIDKNDKYKAVVGCGFYNKDIFDKSITAGNTIYINKTQFNVIGVMECTGSPSQDNSVFIPLDMAMNILNLDSYTTIIAQAQPDYDINIVAENIEEKLLEVKNIKKNDEKPFAVITSEQVLETFNTMISTVNILLISLSFVSIIVAGVVIMNTFYTNVIERRREIGIMKAIGAKNSYIALLFILEALIISLISGFIGMLLGYSISEIAETIVNNSLGSELLIISFDLNLVIFSLAFAAGLGLFSCLNPAINAAHMDPVNAIRS